MTHPYPLRAYVAHPIDYADRSQHDRQWYHRLSVALDVEVYCPQCAYVEGETPEATMNRNMEELWDADRLVAILTGEFTFGTPVEIWEKAMQDARHVCIVTSVYHGLFLKYLASRGATVVDSVLEAQQWLATQRT